MSDEKICFSRSKFTEADAERLVDAGLPGVTPSMTSGAGGFLARELRQLQLKEPKADPFDLGNRIFAAYPRSTQIVVQTYLLGNHFGEIENVTEEA